MTTCLWRVDPKLSCFNWKWRFPYRLKPAPQPQTTGGLPLFSPALVEADVNHPESDPGQRQLSFTFVKRGVLS
jgi:hypothetical protein